MDNIKIEKIDNNVYCITVNNHSNCIYVTFEEIKALIKDAEEFIKENTKL